MGRRGIPSRPLSHLNNIDMKQNRNHRPNRTARRLRRMEDKLDIILCDLNRIHTRLLTVERQQREQFMDATINNLHASAVRMKEMAGKELQAVRERYGTPGI